MFPLKFWFTLASSVVGNQITADNMTNIQRTVCIENLLSEYLGCAEFRASLRERQQYELH
jgi:hypothetical protein